MTAPLEPVACPYCGQPLRMVPQRWFNRGCYQCDRCGDFPDLTATEPARDVSDQSKHGIHIPAGTGRRRVLLVDDAKEQRDLYALMLEDSATVVTASRGEDALAIAAEARLDAIILDVLMPGMSGWDVCARLKQDAATRDIPVIILTSLDGSDAAAPAHRAGAEAVLMKPCPVERLASTIEAVAAARAGVAVESGRASLHDRLYVASRPSTRRWPRTRVAEPIRAHIGNVPVQLINVSYTGVCLAIEQPPAPLPAAIDLTCPNFEAPVRAGVVWRQQRESRTWLWGAEISMLNDEWCSLVDAQRSTDRFHGHQLP